MAKNTSNPYVVEFSAPYVFEGAEYTEVDLSGLTALTGQDYQEIEAIVTSRGQISIMAERTLSGAIVIASRASKQPLEFFNGLPIKEALAVRNMVIAFLV